METIALPRPLRWCQSVEFPHKLGVFERLFRRSLVRHGTCWVHTGAGITWKLDLTNPTHRWIVYGKYEGSAFLDWARAFLPRDGIVVDSGANIGQMLLYLAQWVPDGKVLAFEPGREQADWLAECLSLHPQLPVELIRLGLGASTAHAQLQYVGDESLHGSWNQISETEGEPVQLVRLTDELANRAISKVDLWKLDVEGYEVPALQGAEELLKERRVRALYIELAGDNGVRVRDYMKEFGYRCYLFDGQPTPVLATTLPGHTNGLFLPSDIF